MLMIRIAGFGQSDKGDQLLLLSSRVRQPPWPTGGGGQLLASWILRFLALAGLWLARRWASKSWLPIDSSWWRSSGA